MSSWNEWARQLEERAQKAEKELVALKEEKAAWNKAWHEQRISTGKAWWQGFKWALRERGIIQ